MTEIYKFKENVKPTWLKHPTTIQIDTQNLCNLNCLHCNVKEGGSFKLERGIMPIKTIHKIIEYFRDIPLYCIAPFMNGEPLLETRLHKINDMIEDINTRSIIDTNGSIYENRDLLIHPNLWLVRFTINGCDKETYKKVHGKDLFKDALQTLYWFKEHKYRNQNIMIHLIVNKYNEYQIEEWIKFFEGFERRIFMIHFSKGQDNSIKYLSKSFMSTRPLLINSKGKRSLEKLKPNYPCQCWDILSISHKGDLLQCPDLPYKVNYGNINNTDILEAWNKRNENKMSNPYCLSCNLRSVNALKIFESFNL